jgi:ligand-binding sensor domain-containing protein
MYLKSVIFVFFLSLIYFSRAQNSVVKNYTSNNELPSSQVYDVIEDAHGYLWFSTDKGLSRYNGYEFENFTTDDGLPDNVVFDFHKNANGEIWCTTNSSKLFSISGTQPKFEEYKYNDTLVKYGGSLITSGIHFGADNALYVSYHHVQEFLMISPKGTVLQKPNNDEKKNLFYGSSLYVLADDTSEPFFFLSSKEHSKLNGYLPLKKYSGNPGMDKNEAIHFEKQGTSIFITGIEIVICSQNRTIKVQNNAEVISSGKIDDGNFWIGFRYGGVKTYSLSGEVKESLFTESSVTQLYVDQQKNTWVSTLSKGVFCLRNKSIKYIPETKGNPVNSISLSNSDAIYIGYYNGNIDQVDIQGSHQRFYTPKTHHPAMVVYDSMRKVNFFSSDVLFSSDKTQLSPESSGALGFTHDNILIVTSGSRGIRKLYAKKGGALSDFLFLGKRVKDIVEFNRRIYAATIRGMYVSDKNSTSESNQVVLPNIRIDKLAVFGDYLLVGTHGKGLLILNKQMKVVHSITTKEGLSSNFISSFYCEKNGSIWVATNNGLNRLKIKGKRSMKSLASTHPMVCLATKYGP